MNNVFYYDTSFEGLLCVVFEAYVQKQFPDELLPEGTPAPLFVEREFHVPTQEERSRRVWAALEKKLSPAARRGLEMVWLSGIPGTDMLLFRYIRKTLDAKTSVETDFGDPDVLRFAQLCHKVSREAMRLKQFARFQKAADGTYFAAVEPEYDVLPLVVNHFADRFSDQPWLLYDLRRNYGFYYDLHDLREVVLEDSPLLRSGRLGEAQMADGERQWQQLWKTYFKSIAIRERLNPRLHKQNMPMRFWRHLTEKQD
ncbi:MAG: TIGR03915 family putative DNA repair protein [Bacteroidaceae bacterium]|jgi:probable DNA metabolism protein